MTTESYYRWAIANNIPVETRFHVMTVHLDGYEEGMFKREAKYRLPKNAEEIAPDVYQFERKHRPRAERPYPKYFCDFKSAYKDSGIIVSFRHIRTTPRELFQDAVILGPDEDRNSYMYWYIVELNKHADEKRFAVPYIKTDDGFIALFKSKRKIG